MAWLLEARGFDGLTEVFEAGGVKFRSGIFSPTLFGRTCFDSQQVVVFEVDVRLPDIFTLDVGI